MMDRIKLVTIIGEYLFEYKVWIKTYFDICLYLFSRQTYSNTSSCDFFKTNFFWICLLGSEILRRPHSVLETISFLHFEVSKHFETLFQPWILTKLWNIISLVYKSSFNLGIYSHLIQYIKFEFHRIKMP